MRSSVVSPLRERTSNSSVPRSLIVPAKTVSPGFFSTGMLSPVMGAWLTAEAPETTTPSSAMRSPGRTRTRAPSGTVSALTSSQRPSACFTSAVSGARSISLRIALRARSRLSASIISAMPNSQITTAASGHWPISAAPMTATVISRFMLSDRVRSAIQPFFSVSIPPRAMAASEAPTTGSDVSPMPENAITSAPIASTPAAAMRSHWLFEMPLPNSRVTAGAGWLLSRSTGAMPRRSIAAVIGASSCSEWLTVNVRLIRSNCSSATPGRPSRALRSSASSVGQSIFSIR
mmetsp:Transcript_39062/g.91402  ORF Transcript_39062/g.91402 Transcript_39062/m.91402 type:complete len:290 (+) Transcript_39062:490-1359(+)